MPTPGSARPTRNQMKNELPFMRPMVPVAMPKTNAMKMKVTVVALAPGPARCAAFRSKHAQGPDHREHGDHRHDDPRDRRDEPEHQLEQDVCRDDQNRYGEQLSGCIRGHLSHASSVGGARAVLGGG